MSDATTPGTTDSWSEFFLDLEQVLTDYEEVKGSNDVLRMEYVSTRLEHAIQALRSMLPYANSQDGQLLSEIANNLQVMFLQCSCVIEYPHRSRCSQIAIMAVKTPCAVQADHPGRPKYDIREDTLIELRSLGFAICEHLER